MRQASHDPKADKQYCAQSADARGIFTRHPKSKSAPDTAGAFVSRSNHPDHREHRERNGSDAGQQGGRVSRTAGFASSQSEHHDQRNGEPEYEEPQCLAEFSVGANDLIAELKLIGERLPAGGSKEGCDGRDDSQEHCGDAVALAKGWDECHDQSNNAKRGYCHDWEVDEQWMSGKVEQTQHLSNCSPADAPDVGRLVKLRETPETTEIEPIRFELTYVMPRSPRLTRAAAIAGLTLAAASCSSDGTAATDPITGDTVARVVIDDLPDGPPAIVDPATIPRGEFVDFGTPPEVPDGPLAPETAAAIEELFGQRITGIHPPEDVAAYATLGESGDPRVMWLLADRLRVAQNPSVIADIGDAVTGITGQQFGSTFSFWNELTSTLIAWDIPAPPDYLAGKRNIYTAVEPAWETLFVDNSSVDWRFVSWGGVLIDDRPFDTTDDPCNCIPAADNPEFQTAEEATWLTDDAVIFGVVINGEARAYPRQIMEVREMVNDTLGGRDFAMPYCTLCGSAQVWFTDDVPEGVERPVLRTSGLLSRSNKVMYDLTSQSIFDTFLGTADSGALHDQGVALTGHTVVTSTWGAWVEQNPDTTVLIEDLALGRDFDFRNGRDSDGPIFPIGDVDPRLATQEDVLGVIQENGTPLAIHVNSAAAALDRGEVVEIDGIRVIQAGDGVRAIDSDGIEIVAHQAFWFAWSQFHPSTELWPNV